MMNMYRKPSTQRLPESMRWVASIPDDEDALARGLGMLDQLRGALPPGRERAVEDAKALLMNAAVLYEQAQRSRDGMRGDPGAAVRLLPPARRRALKAVCESILSAMDT